MHVFHTGDRSLDVRHERAKGARESASVAGKGASGTSTVHDRQVSRDASEIWRASSPNTGSSKDLSSRQGVAQRETRRRRRLLFQSIDGIITRRSLKHVQGAAVAAGKNYSYQPNISN